jgi:WD40 repeat protein
VSAASLAATGLQQAASGAVRAALLSQTVKAVSLLAAGEAVAAGPFSAGVSALAEAVLRAMAAAKHKVMGLWVVVGAFVLAGGVAAYDALAALAPTPGTASVNTPADQGLPLRLPAWLPGPAGLFPVEDNAWGVSFSPNGRHFVIATGQGGVAVRVCDVSTGKEVLRTGPLGACWSAAYSPDGKFIVVGSGGTPIHILDARTGNVVQELPAGGRIRNAIFSPDGRLIASSHADGWVRLWDVAQRRALRGFWADQQAVHSAAFTPDGRFLLVIDLRNGPRLYEVASGKEVRQFVGHTARVKDIAVSPDGRRALSCSDDRTIRLWDLQTGKELRRLASPAGLHGVAFCPDGRRAVSGGNDGTVRLWDLRTGQQLYRFDDHKGGVCSVAVSPDGRYALSGSWDHTARLWRLPEPAPVTGE